MHLIKTDKKNICFVGDMHGNFKSIPYMMKHTGFRDTAYIFCGDIGFGFDKPEYYSQIFNRINRTASKFNCECCFIRGNHDDPSYFDNKKINRKYFKAVSDYTVIQSPTHNILCVGGATSIDRAHRKGVMNENAVRYKIYHGCTLEEAERNTPKFYWPDEAPVYNEDALNEIRDSGIKIDIVATHTSPSFAKPLTKDGIIKWLRVDEGLEEEVDNERKVMDSIYNKLKNDSHPVTKWFYGHYHYHSYEVIDNIEFIMLDMFRNGIFDLYDIKEK